MDRWLRGLGGLGLLACAVGAPLGLGVRVGGFALPAVYLLFSALAGTCFGYTLLGKSTCATPRQ